VGGRVQADHRDFAKAHICGIRWTPELAALPGAAWTRAALDSLELEGLPPRRPNQDDRDAVAAALVARQYEEGATTAYGNIIVPAGRLP
jgi:hypothetical protein